MNPIDFFTGGQFPEGQIIAFALVMLRLVAFVFSMPVFGVNTVPSSAKVLLSVMLAFIIFPTVKFTQAELIQINTEIIFFALRELMIGLFLGFLMRMFFYAISSAGELISMSIGLGSAQIFNPAMGTQTNVMEQFYFAIATLFFLSINGHHFFLVGLSQSFSMVSIGEFGFNPQAFLSAVDTGREVLIVGFKMAAPVVVAIFLANISMGILGRAIPQINVLVTSFPVTILMGFGILMLSLSFFMAQMDVLLESMAGQFFATIKIM